MLKHKNSNRPYSYGMMLATTAAVVYRFFTGLFFFCFFFKNLAHNIS